MADSSDLAVVLQQALGKIRHQTSSNLVHQKRPATLLVALETTLTEQGAALTPVAYFAALLSTIQQLLDGQSQDSDGETIPAALYLFAIVLPCIQQGVIKSKVGTLLELLGPQLASAQDQAPTLKSLLSIFQSIYLSMDGSDINSLQSKQTFNTLLAFLVDPRPKVRRKAQETIQAMLANPPAPSIKHPYATRVAEFVLDSLTDALKEGKKGGKRKMQNQNEGGNGNVSEEASRAIGLCAFIKMVGKDWPASSIGSLCALLLSLPRLSNPFLTGASYDILETLFSKSSDSFEEGKVEETLEAVLAARPTGTGSVDERVLPGWLGTVEHGFVAFARSDPERCTQALLSTFKGVLGYLSSPALPVRNAATSTLSALLRYAVSNEEVAFAAVNDSESEQDHPLRPICDTLLSALKSIKYQAVAMPHLLSVVSSLLARLRTKVNVPGKKAKVPAAALLCQEHVKLTGHLRSIEGFEYREAAELVLGSATEVCGPEWVLSLLPLNIGNDSESGEAGRAWLLPIFRTKITNTRLKHFTDYFVPLSETMFGKYREAQGRADMGEGEAAKKRAGIEAKVYEAVVQQIWALFPGYCDLPVDLTEAFTKQFCEILSNVLYTQAHLRPPVFRGLQLLVERNRSIVSSGSTSDVLLESFGVDAETGKRNLQLLSSLAPNLLAVMFNVFSKAGKEGRGYVLDCISAYLSILTHKDLVGTFNKIKTLLLQGLSAPPAGKPSSSDATVPQTMLDFLVQLVPYLPDAETASALLELVLSEDVLQSKDTAVQKRAYRVLLRLCSASGTIGERVLQEKLESVIEELVEKSGNVAASAKKDRTTLLSTIIPLLPSDKLHIIPSIIPEAVLATKEANETARGAAYDLLVGMAEKMAKGGIIRRSMIKGNEEEEADEEADGMVEDAEASIQEYVTMVAAGLAGNTPHMISATITALSRLLFEYHTQLSGETIGELISTILVFLGSANREIVKSSVGFIKVAVVCLAPVHMQPHLEKLVPALLHWSHEHKNHFKLNIRHIFERLLRKFGFDEIEALTGEEDRKLLANIRKRQQRAKRKKEEGGMAVDGQESQDEATKPTATRNAYEEALYGSEDEGDSEEEAPKAAAAKGKPGQQQQPLRKNAIGRRKQDQRDEQGASYIQEGDEPLDLLDEKMLGRISRGNPAVDEARRAKREQAGSSHFKTDSRSGKLLLNDDGDAGGGEEGGQRDEMDSTNAYLEAIRGEDGFRRNARGQVIANKSNKRSRAQLEEDALVEDVKDKLEGLGVAKAQGKREKRPPTKKFKEGIGQDFKAKKAGGDVKKSDGINPYAYVPLGNGKKRAGLNIVNKGKKNRS